MFGSPPAPFLRLQLSPLFQTILHPPPRAPRTWMLAVLISFPLLILSLHPCYQEAFLAPLTSSALGSSLGLQWCILRAC
jgi:hypothetical protein